MFTHERTSSIIPPTFIEKIKEYIAEDMPTIDSISILCDGKTNYVFNLYMKTNGILCGKPFVNMIFNYLNCDVVWFFEEGSVINDCKVASQDSPATRVIVANVIGLPSNILRGERLALNFLKECSEIATNCKSFATKCSLNPDFTGKIAATRKTLPGLTIPQKYAVIVGDCDPHRFNLSDLVMVKDNARDICTLSKINFREYITKLKLVSGRYKRIEVECRNLSEADEVIDIVDIIMLDNFQIPLIHSTIQTLKAKNPNILIEVSGGITKDNLVNYLIPGVDIISTSALFSNIDAKMDFSLKTNNIYL